MALTMGIPALLFPAISLTMLAYNARYLAIAALIRQLHSEFLQTSSTNIKLQIKNLRKRLSLIRNMQAIAILSFLGSVITMFLLYLGIAKWADIVFGISLLALMLSLFLSFVEVQISTKALSIKLNSIEENK
ncbi:MAG: II family cellulose-binding protein [Aquimarina sp.]|nr:II family cellulose-binding protein [Aquimarina sp.]